MTEPLYMSSVDVDTQVEMLGCLDRGKRYTFKSVQIAFPSLTFLPKFGPGQVLQPNYRLGWNMLPGPSGLVSFLAILGLG